MANAIDMVAVQNLYAAFLFHPWKRCFCGTFLCWRSQQRALNFSFSSIKAKKIKIENKKIPTGLECRDIF